ncbi:MAG: spherulation-specific family 4 protein [Hydrogenothermaceae bacterium]|nr:spherulation-specific family 4 protein [Hydrogenothermaceae bacterium]
MINCFLYLQIKDKSVEIIINPSSGVGSSYDQNVEQTILKLKDRGFTVYGYIHSNYSSRNINQIKEEIDSYLQLYPQIDGFFIDETATNNFNYYQDIYNYGHQKGKRIVLNPGRVVPPEYHTIADKIVIFEDKADNLTTKYQIPSNLTNKDCFLIYGVSDSNTAINIKNYLLNKGASCFYITDEYPTTWFRVSPYLDLLLR